jgi:hypothetical protein
MAVSEKAQMLAGELCHPADAEIQAGRLEFLPVWAILAHVRYGHLITVG